MDTETSTVPSNHAEEIDKQPASSDKAGSEQYITFLLAPDSIDAFYAAVKELRKSKFQHNWISWSGKAFVIKLEGSDSSGPGIAFN